jgi:hypothetical protein
MSSHRWRLHGPIARLFSIDHFDARRTHDPLVDATSAEFATADGTTMALDDFNSFQRGPTQRPPDEIPKDVERRAIVGFVGKFTHHLCMLHDAVLIYHEHGTREHCMFLKQDAELFSELARAVVTGWDHVLDYFIVDKAIEREGKIGGYKDANHRAIEHRQMTFELSRLYRAHFHVDGSHATQQARLADVEQVLLPQGGDGPLLERSEFKWRSLRPHLQFRSDKGRRRA